ncbi:MAG: SDR family oxidoreductase [Betaproteobacteria bacterium]|nr:SDR family oxidoreductase [Betaproteobacteria bacterium]
MTAARERVVITGASSGIGAALARHYAGRGATLGLVARRRDHLDRLAASLGTAAFAYAADIRDVAALQAAAADFISRFGVPDVVIANAGVSRGTLTQHAEDLAAFRDVFDINVVGMVNTFQPFLPAMLQARRGTLAGVASVAGIRGLPGAGAYSASKAAAIAYLESLRVELRRSGVKVVTICPGYIDTPMTQANPYSMPFLLSAEEAARRFVRAIDRGASLAVIPWQMALVARTLRLLPNAIYDRLFENAPRKPR